MDLVRAPSPSRNAILSDLAELWAEVLGAESVSPEDDFFALGGDSLKATILAAAIEETLRVVVDPIDIFDWPRLSEFAGLSVFDPDAIEEGVL